jgi:ribonuclease BN (tRNA processing enzyme)
VKITVLGGCGAWPTADQACSGYIAEHDGFVLLIDPGYATLPRLLAQMPAERVDAVLVSHGHPDHCADLNPLLRSRALRDDPPPSLPTHALPGALDAVLALDLPRMLAGACALNEFTAGDRFEIGPFQVDTWALPHFVPNAGLRLTAGDHVLAYTGDTGPSPAIAEMARDADLLLAEATHPEQMPPGTDATYLSTARQAGENAARAGAARLLLTHLWPGTDRTVATVAARRAYHGEVAVAIPGMAVDLVANSVAHGSVAEP